MSRISTTWVLIWCFMGVGHAFIVHRQHHHSSIAKSICLNAKKQKKSAPSGQGFGQAPASQPPPAPKEAEMIAEDSGSMPLQSIESGGSDAVPVLEESQAQNDPGLSPQERTKALLRDKYGLRTREEQELESKKQAKREEFQKRQQELQRMTEKEDVDLLAKLPAPLLIAIDRFLKIGVTLSTVAFVSAGIAITAEAWATASNSPLPEDIDAFITNVVEPNFTPGLGVLLAFSISLGLFATAQLGSDSSQYREDS